MLFQSRPWLVPPVIIADFGSSDEDCDEYKYPKCCPVGCCGPRVRVWKSSRTYRTSGVGLWESYRTHRSSGYGVRNLTELSEVPGRCRYTNVTPVPWVSWHRFAELAELPGLGVTVVQNSRIFFCRVFPGKIPGVWSCTYSTERDLVDIGYTG